MMLGEPSWRDPVRLEQNRRQLEYDTWNGGGRHRLGKHPSIELIGLSCFAYLVKVSSLRKAGLTCSGGTLATDTSYLELKPSGSSAFFGNLSRASRHVATCHRGDWHCTKGKLYCSRQPSATCAATLTSTRLRARTYALSIQQVRTPPICRKCCSGTFGCRSSASHPTAQNFGRPGRSRPGTWRCGAPIRWAAASPAGGRSTAARDGRSAGRCPGWCSGRAPAGR